MKMNTASRLLQISHELEKYIICQHDFVFNFFKLAVFFLSKFSYWFKFHINIVTGSRVMRILVNKDLSRNLEIGNTPVWVLPNIYRLSWVSDSKFGTNISNEKLLNATKCQGYSFYRFWVIKGTPTREVGW